MTDLRFTVRRNFVAPEYLTFSVVDTDDGKSVKHYYAKWAAEKLAAKLNSQLGV